MISKKDALDYTKKMKENLKSIYGSNLKYLYLFGSYARNEATEDSDIDIAVVLETLSNRYEEREKCSKLRAEISLENSCVISLFFFQEKELLRGNYG